MSGTNDSRPCPICNEMMDIYIDWKPFDYSTAQCLNCGFYLEPRIGQMDLESINDLRKEFNENMDLKKKDELKPLKQENLDKYKNDIEKFW